MRIKATGEKETPNLYGVHDIDEKVKGKCIYLLRLQGKRPHFIMTLKNHHTHDETHHARSLTRTRAHATNAPW